MCVGVDEEGAGNAFLCLELGICVDSVNFVDSGLSAKIRLDCYNMPVVKS
jgi:hypothetical protein